MSYRQAYTELEGQFTTVVGETASGNTAAFGANEIGTAEIGIAAVSGNTIASGVVALQHVAISAISGNRLASGAVALPHLTNASVSGLHLVAQGIGADRILNAAITATQMANNAASGLIVSQEFPTLMTGSPSTFGQFAQFGNGTTDGASGLWVVFGRAFKAAPASVITSSRVASIVVAHAPGSITAGSFFAMSEGASRAFDWICCGSGK